MAQSGEKTEKATPKKRRDARNEGNVLKSQDMSMAICIIAMFGALSILIEGIGKNLTNLLGSFLAGEVVHISPMGVPEIATAFRRAFMEFFFSMLPIFITAFVVGLLAHVLQVGFLFTTKVLTPKFSRISPLQGFKRIFSMRSVVDLLKSIIKITIFSVIVYLEYMKHFNTIPMLMRYTLSASLYRIFDMCRGVAFKCGIAFAAIGALDYLFQWWKYEKDLRMTKQEVKDEYKQMEGDPKVKGAIKRKQREMSQMRMMQAVPQADVVITNPTHYAVALRYDEDSARAPIVIAKGKDLMAQRIKAIAKESGVELVENKAVAQALYFAVDLGSEIPEELFQAVAEILAFIFKQKKNAAARAEQERAKAAGGYLF